MMLDTIADLKTEAVEPDRKKDKKCSKCTQQVDERESYALPFKSCFPKLAEISCEFSGIVPQFPELSDRPKQNSIVFPFFRIL